MPGAVESTGCDVAVSTSTCNRVTVLLLSAYGAACLLGVRNNVWRGVGDGCTRAFVIQCYLNLPAATASP